ncbi:DUF2637 domain-containing protein [Actinacidiphila paucisporea]|uniref:DUF2637 domain-containing protein n=1 Tax=Actinacidiphila paucisporea TaxID=310782 RepID=A0A1M6YJ79_9ACTN|nr:DUF2637 domain-containing protein [Actinacidiphila paucisporea]SHL18125.1 Protein of unknown function [Actinacidiphila paucisporea]
MSPASAPTTALVTGWDRLAVIVLGGAGCALSASALMQMAIAIHIRPALCWLFPLVVDGFIAYGIRALLVLRTAPLRARLYVWTLVGTATGVSVWANALHAVRLNQTASSAGGLQLGDTVVAYLSTVAPLALAGAVHLYILIARGPDNHSDRTGQADRHGHGQPGQPDRSELAEVTVADLAGQRSPHAGQAGAGQPVTAPTDPPRATANPPTPVTRSLTGAGGRVDTSGSVTGHHDTQTSRAQAADLGGQPDSGPAVSDRPAATDPVTAHPVSHPPVTDHPVTHAPVSDREPRRAGDRRADLDTEELLEIARSAVRAEDKLTRQVVSQAIRGQKIPLSSATLTALMAQLREQRDKPVTTSRD